MRPVDGSDTEASVIIEWDVAIEMSDGLTLRADVFRPDDARPAPVLLGLGPYAKGCLSRSDIPISGDG